jgi:DNA gyrase subunit A
MVKKTPLTEFAYQLQRGKIAIALDEGDALVNAELTDGERDIMLFASNGKAVRFAEGGRGGDAEDAGPEADEGEAGDDAAADGGEETRLGKGAVRATGRNSRGVRGIRLAEGENVMSLIVVEGDGDILTASENGYGKRTAVSEFPRKGRGGMGVIAMQTSERNGQLVGAIQLTERHEILLISDQGTLVRTRASEVSQVGRNTQGVTLMRMADDEKLIAVESLEALDEAEEGGDPMAAAPDPA